MELKDLSESNHSTNDIRVAVNSTNDAKSISPANNKLIPKLPSV